MQDNEGFKTTMEINKQDVKIKNPTFSFGVSFPDSDSSDDDVFYTQYLTSSSSSDKEFYPPPLSPTSIKKEDDNHSTGQENKT